jgi:hypothetical protein
VIKLRYCLLPFSPEPFVLSSAYRIFMGKPEGKRPLGRPRCRWVDKIKMALREIGWDSYG